MKKNLLHFGASRLFDHLCTGRKSLYDHGILSQHVQPNCSVISVGNIAVGGRGKSPLASEIARMCSDAGYTTTLLLRGYKGTWEYRGGLVSQGNGPLVCAAQCGDEAFAAASLYSNISVRVGARRKLQVAAAVAAGAQVIVLDDGFQHRQLARNLDIVCISPKDVDGTCAFFPMGSLRESPSALKRAHLLAGYQEDWKNVKNGPPLQFTLCLTGLLNPQFEPIPQEELGAKIYLLSAIAVPSRFEKTAKLLERHICGISTFRDHHQFSCKEIDGVIQKAKQVGANAIVTTVKDLCRLNKASLGTFPIYGMSTQLQFHCGQELLQQVILNTLSPNKHSAR